MAQPILVRGAKQLLTLRGPSGVRRGPALRDLGNIEDGSLLIRDGVIVAVGTSRRIENLKEARNAIEIPVNGHLVMPGFVDASFNLRVEAATHSPIYANKREFYEDTLALFRSCRQHGTLTAEVKTSVDGPDLRSYFSLFRQLAKIGSNPVRIVRTCRLSTSPDAGDRAFKRLSEALIVLAQQKLVQSLELKVGSESALGDTALLTAAEHAKVSFKLLWPGGSSGSLADLLHRFNPPTVCCPSHLTPEESQLLSQAQSIVVFSPSQEALETMTPKSARDVVDAGGAVALSTGYDVTYAPTFNMQMVLALAVLRLRLTPEEAITAATINAAYAAGCGHLVGSLEVGKQADILVLNVPDYRELHRQFGINHVAMAIREGNVVSRTNWRAGHA